MIPITKRSEEILEAVVGGAQTNTAVAIKLGPQVKRSAVASHTNRLIQKGLLVTAPNSTRTKKMFMRSDKPYEVKSNNYFCGLPKGRRQSPPLYDSTEGKLDFYLYPKRKVQK